MSSKKFPARKICGYDLESGQLPPLIYDTAYARRVEYQARTKNQALRLSSQFRYSAGRPSPETCWALTITG
ncbi:MAG: hypothetical protein ACPLRX_10095 [Candidatus Saccharicenans sp.]